MPDARAPRGETPHTSFRLSAAYQELLAALAEHMMTTRTEVIKDALRLLARREKIPLTRQRPKPPPPAAPAEA